LPATLVVGSPAAAAAFAHVFALAGALVLIGLVPALLLRGGAARPTEPDPQPSAPVDSQ
jgi:hypothetical protein